jgi:hypothetical protein
MSVEPEQFHDPQLKAAIKRVRGTHAAKPGLREKIMKQLVEEGLSSSTSSNGDSGMRIGFGEEVASASPATRWFRSPTWLALAAALIIAIGGATMYVRHVRHEAEEREEYLAANRPILLAMIASHESRAKDGQALLDAKLDDAQAIAKEMSTKLGREVPAANFAGWKVESASIAKVGDAQAGYLHLTHDGKNLSVISLPASAFVMEEGYVDYDVVLDQHAIAGFLRKESINCVVCDPSVSESEALQLRDELKRG